MTPAELLDLASFRKCIEQYAARRPQADVRKLTRFPELLDEPSETVVKLRDAVRYGGPNPFVGLFHQGVKIEDDLWGGVSESVQRSRGPTVSR
jgi:hypothetical protein